VLIMQPPVLRPLAPGEYRCNTAVLAQDDLAFLDGLRAAMRDTRGVGGVWSRLEEVG
jgi:hypothetical protein